MRLSLTFLVILFIIAFVLDAVWWPLISVGIATGTRALCAMKHSVLNVHCSDIIWHLLCEEEAVRCASGIESLRAYHWHFHWCVAAA